MPRTLTIVDDEGVLKETNELTREGQKALRSKDGYRLATAEDTADTWVVNPSQVVQAVPWQYQEVIDCAKRGQIDETRMDENGKPRAWRFATPAEIEIEKAKIAQSKIDGAKIRAERARRREQIAAERDWARGRDLEAGAKG